jgi:hypothetical protein
MAVVDAVKAGLELHSYFKFRAYTEVMNVLISIEDELREVRVDMVLSWLLASLEAQRDYWKEMDYLIDYIISIARSSRMVAEWFKDAGAKLEYVVDWLNDHPVAPQARQDHFGFKLRKSRTRLTFHSRWETWVQSPEHGPHYLSVDDKKVALQMIMRGDPLPDLAPMPHPDYSNRTLTAGELVDVLDTSNDWRQARVDRVYGSQAYIHYLQFGAEWDEFLDMSSLRVAAAGTIIAARQEDNYTPPGGAAFANG